MSAPKTPDTGSIAATLDGYSRIIRNLSTDFGLHLVWGDLDDVTAGRYDGFSRTVTVNQRATLEEQYYFAHRVWTLCAFGECAVPEARRGPRLRVVE